MYQIKTNMYLPYMGNWAKASKIGREKCYHRYLVHYTFECINRIKNQMPTNTSQDFREENYIIMNGDLNYFDPINVSGVCKRLKGDIL